MPSLTVRFEAVSRWWHQKSPYLLCSSGLALAGTWTLQNVWGFTGHAAARLVKNGRLKIPWCCLRWHVCHMFGSLLVTACSLAVQFDCVSRWWHQKSPYLLCSSGLALAGTWTLQNVWGFTGHAAARLVKNGRLKIPWCCLRWHVCHMFGSLLVTACSLAVQFDCVSRWWHQKSPYLLCSSGLALAGTWTLQNVWGFTGHAAARLVKNGRLKIPWCCLRWHVCHMFGSLLVNALFDCAVWGCEPLMTPKITLPTLFEWTGTCRDVNSPKCLRFHRSCFSQTG